MKNKISAEKELLLSQKEGYQQLLTQAKSHLEYLKGLLAKKPWDANIDKEVNDQIYKIESIEHKLREVSQTLSSL